MTATLAQNCTFGRSSCRRARGLHDLCTGCLTGCYPVAIEGEADHARVVDFVDTTFQLDLDAFGETC